MIETPGLATTGFPSAAGQGPDWPRVAQLGPLRQPVDEGRQLPGDTAFVHVHGVAPAVDLDGDGVAEAIADAGIGKGRRLLEEVRSVEELAELAGLLGRQDVRVEDSLGD